jgi:hypothetical protein
VCGLYFDTPFGTAGPVNQPPTAASATLGTIVRQQRRGARWRVVVVADGLERDVQPDRLEDRDVGAI